ncbi:putative F-box protein PP2-B12 isoform X1 [Carex littledalei]|uniref:Putative F-box protein PP2-B12 isoform X1 n=1 Tax=Carex littledalei TaxID=544730 RepID=A0A833RI95_9POAL|nr:putative F-box protein PP2-B12 isoform X1 [Carex littledalei]
MKTSKKSCPKKITKTFPSNSKIIKDLVFVNRKGTIRRGASVHVPKFYTRDVSRCLCHVAAFPAVDRSSFQERGSFPTLGSSGLIDGGEMAFGLEKSSGAKCFTISARAMSISFIDSNGLWKWVPLFNSRFSEAAQLRFNRQLNKDAMSFSIRIATKTLSSETTYTAYLIYRCTYYEFRVCIPASFLESSVEIGTVNAYNGIVCLHPKCNLRSDVEWPMRRKDRWMEVKVGEFYVKSGEDEKVKIKLQKSEGDEIPCILLLGMEIRANSVESMIRKT